MAVDRRDRYTKPSPIKNQQFIISVNFDIVELDLICAYIISENRNIRRGNIINLRNMFLTMDMNNYKNDQAATTRIKFILKGIEARLERNLVSRNMIIAHIAGGLGCSEVYAGYQELNNNEVRWVNETVSEVLKYAIIYNDIDAGLALLTEFKATDYINRGPVVRKIEDWVTGLQVKFRRSRADTTEDITFSLNGDTYIQAMTDTYVQATSPSNRLVFGTQALNIMTGGGVEAGRVYTVLGLPGEGKSSTLLDMAIQIKRYNTNYKCKDPTKRPCVVLLIMENSVKETVERLFGMCVGQDMTSYTLDDAIRALKNEGNLTINNNDPIDLIIKFKPNLSVDTSYLYDLVEDLEDEGYETICMIQDYMKRIRSVDGSFGGDLRQQLGAVVNEFKTFATLKNVPLITASQLNRTATSSVDEARIKNKADLVRLIGRSNVGESNLILENSDWICLIAPEFDKDGNKYLGIQRVKSRYRIKSDLTTCYVPYIANTIKFIEDIGCHTPMHKVTMRDAIELNGAPANTNGTIGKIDKFDESMFMNDQNNLFANSSFSMSRAYAPNYFAYVNNSKLNTMCYVVEDYQQNRLREMCCIAR